MPSKKTLKLTLNLSGQNGQAQEYESEHEMVLELPKRMLMTQNMLESITASLIRNAIKDLLEQYQE